MTLDQWIRSEGLTEWEAASQLDVNVRNITRWRHGHGSPSLENAMKIERNSRGKVLARGWPKKEGVK